MPDFTDAVLWQRSLAGRSQDDPDAESRDRLRTELLKFRERAKLFARGIPADLPDYTLHDEAHFDGLWHIADLVAGPDYPPLTPTEAFVLGGAFLIHDLGMALAAYPGGLAELHEQRIWKDTIVALLRAELGRYPEDHEFDSPSEAICKQADAVSLRSLHAERAEALVAMSFEDPVSGTQLTFIEDVDIGRAFGYTMGRIAHSHWWAVEQVRREFAHPLGAPGWSPQEWTVDSLKLACLLRVADAGHLSPTRAPVFLRALRRPQGLSADHWVFQERLLQPRLEDDRLAFTSASPFQRNEADTWWLCFDALMTLDAELRQVAALLSDTGRQPFAARAVAGVEDPQRLAEWVEVADWSPVDARVTVTDPLALTERLGGRALYGEDPTIPLRELVQNAADAVRARRIAEARPDAWGHVYVRSGSDDDGDWIEVEDNGIGMSEQVLTGPFLDFGVTYWGSDLMQREFPGLLAKGFRSTGQYGIGFFSVFMWGDRVTVTTQRYDAAQEETLVLEFATGASTRPLLRSASPDERVLDGGTRVRVWLREPLRSSRGLFAGMDVYGDPLKYVCGPLCPCVDVNLFVDEGQAARQLVQVSDWHTMEPAALVFRLLGARVPWLDGATAQHWAAVSANLRPLRDNSGAVIGRACITRPQGQTSLGPRRVPPPGVVIVGGLRACGLTSIVGVLVGQPFRAARDLAIPVVEPQELARWATEQADLIPSVFGSPEEQVQCAQIVRVCGGDTRDLPIALSQRGWLTFGDIWAWESLPDEVLVVGRGEVEHRRTIGDLALHDNVLAIDHGRPGIIEAPSWAMRGEQWPRPESPAQGAELYDQQTLRGAVIGALAQAWSVTPEAVRNASLFADNNTPENQREVGLVNGQPVRMRVYIIRNPQGRGGESNGQRA